MKKVMRYNFKYKPKRTNVLHDCLSSISRKNLFFSCFAFAIYFITCSDSYGQSNSLGKRRDEILTELYEIGIDVSDGDSVDIYCLGEFEDKDMLFYFENGKCFKVATYYNEQYDFERIVNSLEVLYGPSEKMSWTIYKGKMKVLIQAFRTSLYVIEETLISDKQGE